MSIKESEYQPNYERKENYAGEKQKQLRHGNSIICNKLSLGICDDVIVLLNPDEVKIHKYFNLYILS